MELAVSVSSDLEWITWASKVLSATNNISTSTPLLGEPASLTSVPSGSICELMCLRFSGRPNHTFVAHHIPCSKR